MNANAGLSKFRSSALFLTGLGCATVIALGLDSTPGGFWQLPREFFAAVPAPAVDRRPLSNSERKAAHIAWQYIVNNTDPETGLVSSVDGFPSTTLWDQGSYLLGLVAAHRLGIVGQEEFSARANRLLLSLTNIQLFDGQLPNKVYDTHTLAMVNYANEPVEGGIGWSALDLNRMLMGFEALRRIDPSFASQVAQLTTRWNLTAMVHDGALQGARNSKNGPETVQEGRVGYEQYAARAGALYGLDTLGIARATPVLDWEKVAGVRVGADRRRFADYGAITPVLSEPYMLMALEIGLDDEARLLTRRIYEAQRARFDQSGMLTAVSEDHVSEAPYFLYSTVVGNGRDWAVLDEDGHQHPTLRTFSTKAALAWSVLYPGPHADKLREGMMDLADPDRGWYAGRYESDGRLNNVLTLNTNAIVLEALHYIEFGPILAPR